MTLEADHVLAIAEGGSDSEANLTTSCFDCNRGKSDKNLGDTAPAVDEMALLAAQQEMAERREALRAHAQAAANLRTAEDESVALIRKVWDEAVAGHFEEASIRHFLRRIPFDQILYAIDATASKPHILNTYSETKPWKYFCGVCWKLIRAADESEAPDPAT